MPTHRFAVLFALALAPPLARADEAPALGPWERVQDKDGIVVDRRAVAGSQLKEFRGRGLVAVPLPVALAVLLDSDHSTEWMDRCNGSRLIQHESPKENLIYNRTHSPWPVSDRDTVLRITVHPDAEAHALQLDFVSTESADVPPVKHVVRMPKVTGHWRIRAADGGRGTEVEYQVHADPGGSLPDWISNMVSRQLPFRTLLGLRAQVVRRPDLPLPAALVADPAVIAAVGPLPSPAR